jgi:hypothetical protein
MEVAMVQSGYAHFAEALLFVHGNQAMAEAARHAELCEKSGDNTNAARWRKTMNLVRLHAPQPVYHCS